MLRLQTGGDGQIVDLTGGVASVVRAPVPATGRATVFAVGSTLAVTTMEYEPGGVRDLSDALERLMPQRGEYAHNALNHDTNAHAHMRRSIGASGVHPDSGGRPDAERGSRSSSSTSTTARATAWYHVQVIPSRFRAQPPDPRQAGVLLHAHVPGTAWVAILVGRSRGGPFRLPRARRRREALRAVARRSLKPDSMRTRGRFVDLEYVQVRPAPVRSRG